MEYFYVRPNCNIYEPIYHYMHLPYFLMLLESKKYHINSRGNFDDIWESKLDIRCQFELRPVKGDNEYLPPQPPSKYGCESYKIKSELHQQFKKLPAACWTRDSIENALMWTSFANRIGVRIESTPSQVAYSIQTNGDCCLYSEMSYEADSYRKDAYDRLFIKDRSYQDEREVRFYFCRFDDNGSPIPPKKILESKESKNFIEYDVNLAEMIKSVTISPYFDIRVAKKLAAWIHSEYGLNAKPSSLRIDL